MISYQLRLIPLHHAGYLCFADAVDSADDPADFGGYAFRRLLLVQIEFDFQVQIGARHILIIRRSGCSRPR